MVNITHGMEDVCVEYEGNVVTCIALTGLASTWMVAELGR